MSDRAAAVSLVAAQAVLIVLVVVAPGDHWVVAGWMTMLAATLVAVAVVLGLWAARWLGRGLTASPLPNGRTDLVVHGPYRMVRHPMYAAVLLGSAGISIRSGTWWSVAAAAGLLVLLIVKSRFEERHLAALFAEYADYRQRTGRFVPGVRRS